MRFRLTVSALISIFLFSLQVDAAPLPVEKPVRVTSEQNRSYTATISKPPRKPTSKQAIQEQPDVEEDISQDEASTLMSINGIPLPPPMPDYKRSKIIRISNADNSFPYPIPQLKPVFIKTYRIEGDDGQNGDADREITLIYRKPDSPGQSPSYPQMTLAERAYTETIGNLKETRDASPFKTARVQKAGNPSSFDPIIIFFKEETSELEVGQTDILKKDVLDRLKKDRNLSVTINGFAEKNRRKPADTRRLSLNRAMLIQQYLVKNKIASSRLTVNIMEDRTPIEPRNRVDIILKR